MQIGTTVKESEPIEHGLPGHNWTVKKLRCWIRQVFGQEVSRRTVSKLLKQNGLSWKKCQKALGKANPEKRAAFIQEFQALFARVCRQEVRLLYIDESHFHRDMDLGYTWAETDKPAWRLSDCPPLKDRINWYGAYDFSQGQCLLWGPEGSPGNCNGDNTCKFLRRLSDWLGTVTCPVVIIWDGAPCHRAKIVQAQAAELGLTLLRLPGYSPDLNPIEIGYSQCSSGGMGQRTSLSTYRQVLGLMDCSGIREATALPAIPNGGPAACAGWRGARF